MAFDRQNLHAHGAGTCGSRAADVAIADDSYGLPRNLLDVELVPPPRFLAAQHPAEILGEEQDRAQCELTQRLAEDAAPVGDRHWTRDQLGKQHAVQSGGAGMDPFDAGRGQKDLAQHLAGERPREDHIGIFCQAFEGLDGGSHRQVGFGRKLLQQREFLVGEVRGQHQQRVIAHQQKATTGSIVRRTERPTPVT